MDYTELKSKIQNLETLPFDFKEISVSVDRVIATNLLRKAQVYDSQISSLNDKTQEKELKDLLDTILVNRFRRLAPNFSEEQLNKMLCFMYRGFVKYPIDILVIDKAAFIKEAEVSDWGDLYNYEIIMYFNDDYFLAFDSTDFDIPHDYMVEKKFHDRETTMKAFDFICDMINKELRKVYGCNVIMPVYKLNTKNCFYGYTGITRDKNFFKDVKVYFNKQSFEIIDSMLEEKSLDINIVVQDGENISLYIIHQSFKNNKPIWNIEKSEEKVWILSEAVYNE